METYDLETMTLTERSVNRLRTTQRAMERAILGILLRERIRNQNIRRRTGVTDVIERTAKLKWQWVGHIGRQDRERWTIKIINQETLKEKLEDLRNDGLTISRK